MNNSPTPQETAREKAEQIVRANHARTWTAYMNGPAAAAACNDDALVADIEAAITTPRASPGLEANVLALFDSGLAFTVDPEPGHHTIIIGKDIVSGTTPENVIQSAVNVAASQGKREGA